MPGFLKTSAAAEQILTRPAAGAQPAAPPALDDARKTLRQALREHKTDTPQVKAAVAAVQMDVDRRIKVFGGVKHTPAAATENMRNDMYMASDVMRSLTKDDKKLKATYGEGDAKTLGAYHKAVEGGVRFIPTWVKVAVAIALGMGTMVGWKRIVRTVGEKIGKKHLTYGQGAVAELIAASTILMAQVKGAPVSTTHILSSGVTGTMVANGSGIQWSTVRNIASAWIVTLPVAMLISGCLYFVFLHVIGAQPV